MPTELGRSAEREQRDRTDPQATVARLERMTELVREDREEEQQARQQRERERGGRREPQDQPFLQHPGQERDEQDQRRVEADVDTTEGHDADGPSEHATDGTGGVAGTQPDPSAPPAGASSAGSSGSMSGTGAVPSGPVETQSITVLPSTDSWPAPGTCRMTRPGATAGLASS